MNPKEFLALFLGLCGLIFLLWPKPSTHSTKVSVIPRPEKPLFSESPEDLQGIYAYRTGSSGFLQLVKESPLMWRMKDPVVDRADLGIIRQAVLQIFSAPWKDAPKSLSSQSEEQLGLNPARLTLRLQFTDHKSELVIGAATLDRGHRIARLNGALCLIPIPISSWFERNPMQWRDHAALIAPHSVQELIWTPKDGEGFHLQRVGSRWQVLAPFSGPLNPLLEGNLQLFLSARCDSLPVDALPKGSKEAILEDSGILKIFYSNQAKSQGVMDQTLAMTASLILDLDRLFHLPVRTEFFRFLSTPSSSLVSPHVFALDSTHVVSMKLTSSRDEIILRRTASGWRGTLPGQAPQEFLYVQDTLHKLLQVKKDATKSVPARGPDFQLLLSISPNPVARGGEEVEIWDFKSGHYLVRSLSQDGVAQLPLPGFEDMLSQLDPQ